MQQQPNPTNGNTDTACLLDWSTRWSLEGQRKRMPTLQSQYTHGATSSSRVCVDNTTTSL